MLQMHLWLSHQFLLSFVVALQFPSKDHEDVQNLVEGLCGRTVRYQELVVLLDAAILQALHQDLSCPAVLLGKGGDVVFAEAPPPLSWWPQRRRLIVVSSRPCPDLEVVPDVVLVCRPDPPHPDWYRRDFQGRQMRLSSYLWPPFVMKVPAESAVALETSGPFNAGIEMKFIHLLAQRANISLSISDDGPENYEKMAREVLAGEIDGCFGSYGIGDLGIRGASPYLWESIVVLVPLPWPISGWKRVFLTFDIYCWGLLVLSYVVVTVVVTLVSTSEDDEVFYSAQSTLRVLLCQSLEITPRGSKLRSFITMWIVFCLLMNTAFQSKLIDSLVNPGLEGAIRDEDHLLSSSVRLVIPEDYRKLFLGLDDPRFLRLATRAEGISSYAESVSTAIKTRSALVADWHEFSYNVLRRVAPGTQVPFRQLGLPLWSYLTGAHFAEGSPFLPRLDELIVRINEAGLSHKWWSDLLRSPVNRSDLHDDDGGDFRETERHVLTLTNVQSTFWLLAVGLVLSSVVFVLEVLMLVLIDRQKKYKSHETNIQKDDVKPTI